MAAGEPKPTRGHCVSAEELLLHALLGDHGHGSAKDQNAADHVEQCGTDTTGGGQDGTGLVDNIDRSSTVCNGGRILLQVIAMDIMGIVM